MARGAESIDSAGEESIGGKAAATFRHVTGVAEPGLGSGPAAGAVVNTLLRRPEDAHTAMTFHQTRAEEAFPRYSRVGREVVVTPDNPCGIWRVDDVPLAPLYRLARARGATRHDALTAAAAALCHAPDRIRTALGWLRHRGMIDG